MAKRLTTKRHDTSEVQGDGSFVVMKRPSVKDFRALISENKELLADQQSSENGDAVSNMNAKISTMNISVELIENNIVEWNWVDDDDKLLPLPDANFPIDELINDLELNFLAQLFANEMQATQQDAKKKATS